MLLKLLFTLIFSTLVCFGNEFSDTNVHDFKPYKISIKTKNINWDELLKKSEKQEDEIKQISSSVMKDKKTKTKKISKDEEMVFFTYDTPENKEVIKTPKEVPVVKLETKNKVSKQPQKKQVPQFDNIDFSQFISSAARRNIESYFEIKTSIVGSKGLEKKGVTDFDLVPNYDTNQLFTDSGTGVIKIPIANDDRFYNFKGSIAARNVMRTNFELAVRENDIFNIPLFDESTFDTMVRKYIQTEEYGAYLLINLGEEIDSTSLDGKFKKKIYLDHNLKEARVDNEYQYELYIDIEPGNTLIRYMDMKGDMSEKIIHLTRGEVTYDESNFHSKEYLEFELVEENLLSKKTLPIEMNDKRIRFFNTNIASTKIGLNRYKLKIPRRDYAFRKYLEIDYGQKIFVGVGEDSKIKLPGEDFIPYLKSILGIDDNTKACFIQLNLKNALKDFHAQVTSTQETGSYDIYYMDKDGTLSKELTGLTEKIFVYSNDYGVINMKLKDINNNTKYYQSFCTDSLYLIEQI
ncbi:hypothetical protein [Bacteriovorax sp. Seq25_V]|uniref:hypothetical protein n=1 Tax=Bacteriovorax sp. Seq25_V TaxID=1201288 RepID=UPI000389EA15|nr:hypothetical protein [Bacteriovorax sp. Seq25_V]EQC43470.1 hypothetical protein M900_2817 [Bacteriovorax sp. Seq25_V]